MMDAIVQFIRNGLCCIKDLELLADTFIHDPWFTALVVKLPEPLDKTSPLELMIGLTQLYAAISTTKAGISLLNTSIGKLRRINRLVERRSPSKTKAEAVVLQSLFKEAKLASRSVLVGFLITPIGVAFHWLFANSFHVTETDWIGGVAGLIHALEVMELCLLPLLYYMIVDGFERLKKSKQAKELRTTLTSTSKTPIFSNDKVSLPTYEALTGWVPFWCDGESIFASPQDAKVEEALLDEECKKITEQLRILGVEDDKKDGDDKDGKKKDDGEKDDKIRNETIAAMAEKLEADAAVLRMEGYREFVYFVLNFVAFYGYLMAPLTFYYQNEEEQPYHIQSMKLWLSNELADWRGNFAGDLMWTIEPIIILSGPFMTSLVKPKTATKAAITGSKDKAD